MLCARAASLLTRRGGACIVRPSRTRSEPACAACSTASLGACQRAVTHAPPPSPGCSRCCFAHAHIPRLRLLYCGVVAGPRASARSSPPSTSTRASPLPSCGNTSPAACTPLCPTCGVGCARATHSRAAVCAHVQVGWHHPRGHVRAPHLRGVTAPCGGGLLPRQPLLRPPPREGSAGNARARPCTGGGGVVWWYLCPATDITPCPCVLLQLGDAAAFLRPTFPNCVPLASCVVDSSVVQGVKGSVEECVFSKVCARRVPFCPPAPHVGASG